MRAGFLYKEQCPECLKKGRDTSGDNLAVYADNGKYCFSCGYTEHSDTYKAEHYTEEHLEEEYSRVAGEFNRDIWLKIRDNTSPSGNDYRGISDRTYKTFNVRHEFDTSTGEVVRQYCPTTIDYRVVGMKVRIHPKDFSKPLGKVGKDCNLFGQLSFQTSVSKTLIIGSGEIDAMSIFDMMSLYTDKKGYDPYPVVSSTIGEGAVAQFANNYEWIDRFEKIVICPDMDEAGEKAAQKLLKVLPKGKVYIMELPLKDANEMLRDGRESDFINRFWRAKPFIPEGLTASTDLEDKMMEYLSIERLSLPTCMHRMQTMLRGGFPIGHIINILSGSGTGKSTITDAMTVHWIMNTDRKVGIMAMEASEGEYGVNLASAYLGFKINLLPTKEERMAYLRQPEVREKLRELWQTPDGQPRFYLMDAAIDNVRAKSEYLIKSLGCSILIFDPIQDILDIMPDDEQQKFLSWQKEVVKGEMINIFNVNHARKNASGATANSKGADLTEEDMHGTSSLYKSGAVNIIMMRNKEAEDEIDKNTTRLKITKARGVGNTGNAGELYYENETHTLYDKEDWEWGRKESKEVA